MVGKIYRHNFIMEGTAPDNGVLIMEGTAPDNNILTAPKQTVQHKRLSCERSINSVIYFITEDLFLHSPSLEYSIF